MVKGGVFSRPIDVQSVYVTTVLKPQRNVITITAAMSRNA